MKIAYLTVYDVLSRATDLNTQVGLFNAGYYISKNLENESTSLDYVGPLQKKYSLLTRAKWTFYRSIFKKDYYRWYEPLVSKDYAHQIAKKLDRFGSDIVLCPENIVPIAYLKCKQPIVLWTDSTLTSLINYYPFMSNLCKENIRNVYEMEASALKRCQLIIYTSNWAAQAAIKIYGIEPSKVKVVPWGANLECNRTAEDIYTLVNSKVSSPCKLLFCGVDWVRKGGNLALEVTKELNRIGIPTELTIIGCKPITEEPLPDYVKVLGFIDKSSQAGSQQINQLFADSHFLIFPSQAECYGHVLCEANSFGVPCITTDVGGIPTIIREGFNGKTFSIQDFTSQACAYIISLIKNYSEYQELALSSFEQYQSRLNWNVAAGKVRKLLRELVR